MLGKFIEIFFTFMKFFAQMLQYTELQYNYIIMENSEMEHFGMDSNSGIKCQGIFCILELRYYQI